MFFKRLFWARGLQHVSLVQPPEPSFNISTAKGSVTIVLRHPTEDEKGRWEWQGDAVVCETTSEREPSPKVRAVYDIVSRREIPETVNRSGLFPGDIDEEGRIRSIGLLRMSDFSAAFANDCRVTFKELAAITSRTVSVLRWRLGLEQGPQPIAGPFAAETFSFDRETWFHLHSDICATAVAIHPATVSDDLLVEIARIINDGREEPLPHFLFREAWALRSSNPRSSLLVGVAAAEVAMKHFIAQAVPEARWLVENLQSPPVDKMAEEYLPNLLRAASTDAVPKMPEGVLEELKKAITLRNKLSHRGEYDLNHMSLSAKLLAIRDLLWLLEYFAGNRWALAYVRPESLPSGIEAWSGRDS